MSDADRAIEIARRCYRHLGGEPAQVQGGALADLVARWLAGHHVEGSADATAQMRAKLLANHIAAVRALVPLNAKIRART